MGGQASCTDALAMCPKRVSRKVCLPPWAGKLSLSALGVVPRDVWHECEHWVSQPYVVSMLVELAICSLCYSCWVHLTVGHRLARVGSTLGGQLVCSHAGCT
jgi:hypothetical protein